MKTKEPIKISLPMFFLIFAIIVIFIMGCFMYVFNNKNTVLQSEISKLNAKNQEISNELNKAKEENNSISVDENTAEVETAASTISNASSTQYSYSNINGAYKVTKNFQLPDSTEKVDAIYTLILYSNGTFSYGISWQSETSLIGNYIIDGDTLILNKLFEGGGDIGRRTTSGELKLKINSDGTITDTNNILDFSALANVTLKKVSDQLEKEILQRQPSIMTDINNSISENTLTIGK